MEMLAEIKAGIKRRLKIAQTVLVIALIVFWIVICVFLYFFSQVYFYGSNYYVYVYSMGILLGLPVFLRFAYLCLKYLDLAAVSAIQSAEIASAKIKQ